MGGRGEIAVFDLHGDASGQLPGCPESFGHALGKAAQDRSRFFFCQGILREGGGISDPFCPCGQGFHRTVIDPVGIFPEKTAMTFQMGGEKVCIRVGQFSDGVDAQLL